ncbi:hypothetical protein ACP70R_030890 [Stipagrostis hirtigluma subsp. patula]
MAKSKSCLLQGKKSSHPAASIISAIFLFIILVFSATTTAAVTDTLLPGQSISGTETLTSKSGVFELGSFASNFYEKNYLGVRYKSLMERSPVFRLGANDFGIASYSNATLHFHTDMLYIDEKVSGWEFVLWSSNSTTNGSAASVAILLDTGNFVLRDEMNLTIWQSFDYPGDALLPGQWIRLNPVSGADIEIQSGCDPYNCTLHIYGIGRANFSVQASYLCYYGEKKLKQSYGKFPDWMFTYKEDGSSVQLNVPGSHNSIQFMNLELGEVILLRWLGDATTGGWQNLWSFPSSCNGSSFICGAFGACTEAGKCRCIDGFQPRFAGDWENGYFASGCWNTHPLKCEDGGKTTDSFVLMDNLWQLGSYNVWPAGSSEECKSHCLSNCHCTAYSYSSMCKIWFHNLLGLSIADNSNNSIYVRVGSAEQKGLRTQEIVAWVAGLVAIIVIGSLFFLKYKGSSSRRINVEGFLVVYPFAQLKKATRDFSDKLGEGAFGSVFKGKIAGSTFVAVKVLKGLGYGDKQFRTEVQTIGMIQQTNIVRLLGFCVEGARRLLVYEYMANGSLDTHLFSENSSVLTWNLRYRIALGIAKGLAYLHEECNGCIIHCDIKPENILLDAEFCPKIADFGMAKLLQREFSAALTTFRGTIGYLAPEWLSGQAITCKADVYSFGIVLFELISGRRTTKKVRFGDHSYFPSYAAAKVNEREVLCLLDSRLDGNAVVKELDVTCRVACWCIQDDESHRPSMGQVVRMLEGVVDTEMPPIPASFHHILGYDDSGIYSAEGSGYRA